MVEYNAKGMDRLVKLLGIEPEVNKLLEMGLTVPEFADVLYHILDPKTTNFNQIRYLAGHRLVDYPCRSKKHITYHSDPQLRFKRLVAYFGLGTERFYRTFKKVGKNYGPVTNDKVSEQVRRFRSLLYSKIDGNLVHLNALKNEIYQRSLEKILEPQQTDDYDKICLE